MTEADLLQNLESLALRATQRRAELQALLEHELADAEGAVDAALKAANDAGISLTRIADAVGTSNRSGLRERIRRVNAEMEFYTTTIDVPMVVAEPSEVEGVEFEILAPGELYITAKNWGPRNVTGDSEFWYEGGSDEALYFGPKEGVYDKNMEVIDQIGHAVQIENMFYIDAIRTWLEANA